MKKLVSLIMVILMFIPVFTVYGGEEDRVMMIVTCPEQNFATVCRPEYSYEYTPDGGLQISLGDSDDAGMITIFKTDAPGGDFDAEAYFNNAYYNLLVSSYGDNLIDPGEYNLYPFGNLEMPGRMALYLRNGVPYMRFCLYDLEEDYFVRYETFCAFDDTTMQNTIDDLSDAVRYFQPDAQYYSSEPQEQPIEEPDLTAEPASETAEGSGIEIIYPEMPEEAEAGPGYKTICCTAQRFSTRCGYYDTVEFKDNLGVTCFLDTDGEIVWVRIQRLTNDAAFDAEMYFYNKVIPSMRSIYGEDGYGEEEFTSFSIDGKELPGQEYHFTIAGYDYTRRIMICQTDDDLIRFEAQYTQDTYNSVMKDLERVVAWFQPDPYYYTSSSASGSQTDLSGSDPQTDISSIDLQKIECPQLGFSVQTDASFSWDYQEGTGISIYTESAGKIPYVIVYQSEDLYLEPYELLREQYTPYMEEKYGEDLISADEYESMEFGGRQLPAGVYTYNVDGHIVHMLRIMDSTGSQTVIYTVKYEEDYEAVTLNALDIAVRTFERY
ncbi:MAG: hypothetical protein IJ106_02310 [Parasporobacterium sp.]|nr:hypothetical protein [Parasporobacterium sp.]